MAANAGTVSHIRAAFADCCPSNKDLKEIDISLVEMREEKKGYDAQASMIAKWLVNGIEYNSWPVTKPVEQEAEV
jgi:hypothetical protein